MIVVIMFDRDYLGRHYSCRKFTNTDTIDRIQSNNDEEVLNQNQRSSAVSISAEIRFLIRTISSHHKMNCPSFEIRYIQQSFSHEVNQLICGKHTPASKRC